MTTDELMKKHQERWDNFIALTDDDRAKHLGIEDLTIMELQTEVKAYGGRRLMLGEKWILPEERGDLLIWMGMKAHWEQCREEIRELNNQR
jgi:hypothetical protein